MNLLNEFRSVSISGSHSLIKSRSECVGEKKNGLCVCLITLGFLLLFNENSSCGLCTHFCGLSLSFFL